MSINAMFTVPDLARRQSETVGARPQASKYGDSYRTTTQLGSGGFGTVRACVSLEDGKEYAVKVVDKTARPESVHDEVQILQLLKSTHPNFVQLKETFETRTRLYIVMEMVAGGMLLRQIERSQNFSEATARRMVKQLLIAVEFMHGKGIVHRDLKPANLLLTESNIDATIKICDFGFAKLIGDESTITGRTGTLLFMAPEVIVPDTAYGKPVDMWSLGVIFYIMLCGYPPFTRSPDEELGTTTRFHEVAHLQHSPEDGTAYGLSQSGCGNFPSTDAAPISAKQARKNFDRQHLVQQILNAQIAFPEGCIWANVSDACKDFLRQLLTVDPEQRMTASDALAHPWMRGELMGVSRRLQRQQFHDYPSLRAVGLSVHAAVRMMHLHKRCGVPAKLPVQLTVPNLMHGVLALCPIEDAAASLAVAQFLLLHKTGRTTRVFRATACGLTDTTVRVILEALCTHTAVETVDLSKNADLTEASEGPLLNLIAANTRLRKILLSETSIPKAVVDMVQRGLSGRLQLEPLRELHLARPSSSNIPSLAPHQRFQALPATGGPRSKRLPPPPQPPSSMSSDPPQPGGRKAMRNLPRKPAVPTLAALKQEHRVRQQQEPLLLPASKPSTASSSWSKRPREPAPPCSAPAGGKRHESRDTALPLASLLRK